MSRFSPFLGLLHPLDTVISVIASDRKAKRVGTALLVVDGTDEVLNRRAEIALLPGRVKARSLSKLVSLSREIYNATVQAPTGRLAPGPGDGHPVRRVQRDPRPVSPPPRCGLIRQPVRPGLDLPG